MAVCPGSRGEKERWWPLVGSAAEDLLGGGGAPRPLPWGERGREEEAGRNGNVKRVRDEKQKGIRVCSCTSFVPDSFM